MPLRLIIEDDEGTTTIVPLASDAITIGRQQGNTIQLTEKNVSRRHARLFPDSDGWIIEDLNSYNGIKVNGQSTEGRLALSEGDVIQIGDYHLALTEDVDKRSLNYEGRDAANDPGGEPMLASSSSDLPQLSAEELAALSSGPQTPQPAAMLMDSGQVPAAAMPASYADEPQRKGGAGMLIVAGVALIALLAIVWFVVSPDDDSEPDKDKKVATSSETGAAKATPAAGAKQVNPPGSPTAPAPTGDTPPDSPQKDPPPGDSGAQPVPVAPTAPDTPSTSPGPGNNTKKKPSAKKKPSRPRDQPKPTQPAADPSELLAEARKLVYKNPSRAYALAKQSHGIKRSQDALYVMATAACRMRDATKARSAIKQLKTNRETMIKSCEKQGIAIE